MRRFISAGQVAQCLKNDMTSYDPNQIGGFCTWNGRKNDIYLTDLLLRHRSSESFLIKVERPNGHLKLLYPRFQFEWSSHFDPTGRYYLFSGHEKSTGVFVRDLESAARRVLVAPDSGQYYSIPQFYRDSVIYVRSNALWRININGSDNIRLFPIPKKPLTTLRTSARCRVLEYTAG